MEKKEAAVGTAGEIPAIRCPELLQEGAADFFVRRDLSGGDDAAQQELSEHLCELGGLLNKLLLRYMGTFQAVIRKLNGRCEAAGLRGWYNLPPEELSTNELLLLIIYPFCKRMAGSFEEEFAKNGELGRYLLLYREKCPKSDKEENKK